MKKILKIIIFSLFILSLYFTYLIISYIIRGKMGATLIGEKDTAIFIGNYMMACGYMIGLFIIICIIICCFIINKRLKKGEL